MNRNRVEKIIEYVKGSPETMDYGRWGALNPEQRKNIKELCNSWLILDKATNIQTKEIERLNNIIKELSKENQELKEKTKLFHKNRVFSLEYDKETLRDMVLEYQEKIDKAIEYIEDNSDDMHTYISQVLTDILKGSDKE